MSIFNGEDVFLEGAKIPPLDADWLGFFTLILVTFIVQYLENPSLTSPGLIYIMLSIISLAFALGAFLSDNQFFGFVMHGESTELPKQILDMAVGVTIGIILVGGLLGLSIAYNPSPFSLAPSTSLANNLITLFVIGFFGVEAEEMFRASTFIPSVLRYISNETYILAIYAGIIIMIVVLLIFLIQLIGTLTFYVLIGFIIVEAIIIYFYNPRKGVQVHPVFMHFQSIILAGVIFMTLHVLAYGNGSFATNTSSYIAAFIFAVMMDSTNALLGSAIASRMAHSVNNCVLTCIALALPLWYGGIIILMYGAFIVVIGQSGGKEGFNALTRRAAAVKWLSSRN